MSDFKMFTGGCLCGAVKFEISAPLQPVQICHCMQCRKAQGGPFAANIPVAVSDFKIVSGTDCLKEFKSSTREGKSRLFCKECGSAVMSKLDTAPDVIRVRSGLINESLGVEVGHHQFVEFAVDWCKLTDDAPRYKAYPTG